MTRATFASVRPYLNDQEFASALLLVSEAVTNAVVHGARDGSIHVTAEIAAGVLHVEVQNEAATTPPPERRDGEGGLGLRLVDRLADDWGIEHLDQTRVWFDVPAVEPASA